MELGHSRAPEGREAKPEILLHGTESFDCQNRDLENTMCVWGLLMEGVVNGGDESEEIWLMCLIYIYEIE
jgi:hypothetical protein